MYKNFLIGLFLIILELIFFANCAKKTVQKIEKVEIMQIETNKVFIPEETTNEIKKINLLILPLKDKSNKKDFPASGNIKTIVFNSLFDFISIVPSIEIKEKDEANEIYKEFKEINPEEIFSKYNTEVIIFGDYYLNKKKNKKPEIIVNFYIWNRATNSIIKTKYVSKTEFEIFDVIDNMLANIIKTTFNEDLKISYLNFENFDINNGKYYLIINNRVISVVTNSDFRLSLKILSGFEYFLKLKNLKTDKIVLNTKISLKSGEITNIEHKAMAIFKCEITNRKQEDLLKILVDGKEIEQDKYYTIPAEKELIIRVTNIINNDSYELKDYIFDGEEKTIFLPKALKIIKKFDISTSFGVGAKSSFYYSNEYKLMNKESLVFDFSVPSMSWAHIVLIPDNSEILWSKYNTINFWIYGRKSGKVFLIKLLDKTYNEFIYLLQDNWEGWKKISVPFSDFKHSSYYYDSFRINKKIKFPVNLLVFEANSYPPIYNYGSSRIIINKIELSLE